MSSIDDTETLKPKQVKALVAVAAGASDERAAEVTKVAPSTIARWRRLPAFQAALQDHLRLQRDRIQGILGALAQESEQVIRDAMGAVDDDSKPAHATRLRAAEAALGTYARISQRAADAGGGSAGGPLIVLPPGTRRMALALDDGGPAGPAADPAPPADPAATGAPVAPHVDAQILRADPASNAASNAAPSPERTQHAALPPARQLAPGPIALVETPADAESDAPNH